LNKIKQKIKINSNKLIIFELSQVVVFQGNTKVVDMIVGKVVDKVVGKVVGKVVVDMIVDKIDMVVLK
jgi:hypothetical protein